jgi:nicotinamide mononucleotide transporter
MTRKVLENWAIWIVLDLVYVPTFIYRGMYAMAALYFIFLILAALGWRDWKRAVTPALATT